MTSNNTFLYKIEEFIKDNSISCYIENNTLLGLSITMYDGMLIRFNEEDNLLCTFYKSDMNDKIPSTYRFNNINELLSWILYYSNSIPRVYVTPIIDDLLLVPVYQDNWNAKIEHKNFLNDDGICVIEYPGKYILKSHLNDLKGNEVDKLYIEVYPTDLTIGLECFVVRILLNNEEILKEFSIYRVETYKYLNLFIENIRKTTKK